MQFKMSNLIKLSLVIDTHTLSKRTWFSSQGGLKLEQKQQLSGGSHFSFGYAQSSDPNYLSCHFIKTLLVPQAATSPYHPSPQMRGNR